MAWKHNRPHSLIRDVLQDNRNEVKFSCNVAGISLSDLDVQFRGQKHCHLVEWHCQSAMYPLLHVCFVMRTFAPVRKRAFLFQICPLNVTHVSQESCPFQSWWKLSLVTLTTFYLLMKAKYNEYNSSFNGLWWLYCNYIYWYVGFVAASWSVELPKGS